MGATVDTGVNIRLQTNANLRGTTDATRGLNEANRAAEEFFNTLKLGVGIDIGGRIVQGISQIPDAIQEAIARGVAFNSTLEDTQTAVAAVLEKFNGLSRDEAIKQAGRALDELKRQAVDAPGTIEQLSQAWIASAGAASAANIPVNQQIDLMVRLSQACSRLALPQQQLVQETRALLTGNITLDAQLAKTLGVTNESIRAAREQGRLYEYLVAQIGALGEASDTLTVRQSNLTDAVDQLLGKLTVPVFDEIRKSVGDLQELVSDPKTAAALKSLGFEIAQIVKGGAALTEWAIKNAPTLVMVGKAAGLLAVALASLQIAKYVTGLVSWTLTLGKSAAALNVETAALARNTAAQAANAASRGTNARTAVGGPVPGLGAPFMYPDYRAARAGGATAAEATRQARGAAAPYAAELASQRRSILDANAALANLRREAAATGGTFSRLRGLVPTGVGTISQALGGLSIAAVAASIAEAIKANQQADLERLTSEANSRLAGQADLMKRSHNVTSEDERQALLGDIDKALAEAVAGKKSALAESLGQLFGRVRDMEIKPQASAALSADSDAAANIEANRKAQDAAAERSIADSRGRAVEEAITAARKAANTGAIDSLINDYRQRLDESSRTAGDLTLKPELRERAEADQGQYMDLLKKLRSGRTEVLSEDIEHRIAKNDAEGRQRVQEVDQSSEPEADKASKRLAIENEVADRRRALEDELGKLRGETAMAAETRAIESKTEAEKRAMEVTRSADEKRLQEQLDQIEASGRLRLAQAEATRGTEQEIARARYEIEDDIARKRLEVEREIGRLHGESATAREAREVNARAEQLERENALSDALEPEPTPSGRINARAKFVKGYGRRTAIDDRIDVNASGLDTWHAMNPGAPLAPQLTPRPPEQPAGQAKPTGEGAQGANAAVEKFSQEMQALTNTLSSLITQATSAVTATNDTLTPLIDQGSKLHQQALLQIKGAVESETTAILAKLNEVLAELRRAISQVSSTRVN